LKKKKKTGRKERIEKEGRNGKRKLRGAKAGTER
jgi:hypothetical protein